ncbi:PAS domain-containing protein, partial [Myxococcota bacterium]|nr:PAS domain-containing protein [Myxococcota bacterium]
MRNTKQIMIEEALRQSEARLKETQRLAKVGSWEYDMQTGEIWASDEGFHIYGLTPPPSNLLPIDEIEACIPDRKRVNQALVDLINEGKPYDLEFDIFPADGSARKTIISKAKLERDDEGNLLRVSGVIQDITERQKTKEALKRIEWLLTKKPKPKSEPLYAPPYGDVTELNTCGEILGSLGPETLSAIASQSIELLESSVAVYESNGDYAFGMFTSGWCQFMDAASRNLCGDMDNRRAL